MAFILAVPLAGLVAVVSGVVGLAKAKQAGRGRGQATLGLLGGIAIFVLTGADIWYIWAFAHSNWQF